MPDYSHADMQPHTTLLVHFRNVQDRQAFARLVGQNLTPTTKFVWFPRAEIGTAADKVWTSAKVNPRYPVYIISKGRADTRLTSRAFEWSGVPYHIVVEPQEYDVYAAVIDPKKILVTPFSNLEQGGIPARNFVWEHAISTGAERHWIFDDNVSGFCRFQDNLKVEVDSGILHRLIEDWCDRYENVAMAAFNYDYFAPRKQGAKIKPITLNTRCYSGILLSNKIPHRWRGRYNEDTDLSLRILKDGLCTALFNAFLMYKKPTMTMKGGNTDELYAGMEATAKEWAEHCDACATCKQCFDGYSSAQVPCEGGRQILDKDGRWRMAEALREQQPDVTTVGRKWGRWQHQVDYRRFQRNELIPKQGVVVVDADYDLKLDAMPSGWGAMSEGTAPSRPAPTPRSAEGQPARPSGPSAMDFVLGSAPAPPLEPAKVRAEAPAPEPKPALAEPGRPEPSSKAEAVPVRCDGDHGGPRCADPECWNDDPQPEHVGPIPFKIDLEARGHRLLTKDGKLFVSEASRLTEKDRKTIKTFKEELIKLATPWIETSRSTDGDVQASARSQPAPEKDLVTLVPGNGAQAADDESACAAALADVRQPGSEPGGSFFESTPVERAQSLAQLLGSEPPRVDPSWRPDEPPDLTGVDEIVLNFATDGLDWARGSRPVGVTVSTLNGQLTRFLPFGFRGGGNLDEGRVKEWFKQNVRGKRVVGANTRFEVHMAREWGCDLEEQGCTVSDVMHYAALLDDHRKKFALDVLVKDFLPDEPTVERLDERDHAQYAASEVHAREHYTAEVTAKLRNAMWPMLDKEELQEVRQLEDDVIFAVCEMEKNGAPLDMELLERYTSEVTTRHGELMMELANEAGFAFDGTTKSWQRLFEKCGLPPTDSIAEGVIDIIDHPLVKKAHFAGQLASLNSKTFAAYRKNVDADGVLRFDINQLRGDDGGTVSGRFSIGYVQQVPNHDNHSAVFGEAWYPRRLFVPSREPVDGFVPQYLEADAAQIEYRLFAHYANNPEIVKKYQEDPWTSFHKMTWKMMKQYKPDMLYTHQKSFNFARQYGAKMVKLALMMGFIDAREAAEIKQQKRWNDPKLAQIKEIEAAYKKINPEGDELLDRASHLAKPACDDYCKRGDKLHRQYPHRGFVKTLAGRRSRFRDSYKTYIGLNRVLQGGGADIMKRKLYELHRERKHTGLLMRMTVHDAATGDAQTPETKQRVEEVLNAQSYPLKVDILWEVGVGSNWAEAKK